MENSDAPFYLTEGEKKAAKVIKEGLLYINFAGIFESGILLMENSM